MLHYEGGRPIRVSEGFREPNLGDSILHVPIRDSESKFRDVYQN